MAPVLQSHVEMWRREMTCVSSASIQNVGLGWGGGVDPCAFMLEVPWCTSQLRWRLSFSPTEPETLPDVLTHEKDFVPWLQDDDRLVALQHTPMHAGAPGALAAFVDALLALYAKYVQSRVLELRCKRIEFELAACAECPDLQLDVDFSPITGEPSVVISLPLRTLHQRLQQGTEASPTARPPRLLATFRVHGSMPPDLRLHVSEGSGFRGSVAGLLPPWNPEQSLAEYRDRADECVAYAMAARQAQGSEAPPPPQQPPLPQAVAAPAASGSLGDGSGWATPESRTPTAAAAAAAAAASVQSGSSHASLAAADQRQQQRPPPQLPQQLPHLQQQQQPQQQQQQQQHPSAATEVAPHTSATPEQQSTTRGDLLDALARAFGPPTEVLPNQRKAHFLFTKGEAFMLVLEVSFFETDFPAKQPRLTVYSAKMPHQSQEVHSNMPWSPRWSAQEMAHRIFNYIKSKPPPSGDLAMAAKREGGGGGGTREETSRSHGRGRGSSGGRGGAR